MMEAYKTTPKAYKGHSKSLQDKRRKRMKTLKKPTKPTYTPYACARVCVYRKGQHHIFFSNFTVINNVGYVGNVGVFRKNKELQALKCRPQVGLLRLFCRPTGKNAWNGDKSPLIAWNLTRGTALPSCLPGKRPIIWPMPQTQITAASNTRRATRSENQPRSRTTAWDGSAAPVRQGEPAWSIYRGWRHE